MVKIDVNQDFFSLLQVFEHIFSFRLYQIMKNKENEDLNQKLILGYLERPKVDHL